MKLYDPARLDPKPLPTRELPAYDVEADLFAAQVRLFEAEISLRARSRETVPAMECPAVHEPSPNSQQICPVP